jgi:hypothetical protein
MKKLNIALLALVSFASTLRVCAQTGVHTYLQASAIYAFTGEDFKSGPGVAFEAGLSVTKHHSIEMEVISFNTETKGSNNSYYYSDKTVLKFMPLLLTYRYTFPVNDQFAAFAGFSLGASYTRYEISNTSYPSYYTSWTKSGADTVVSGGPQIGCVYKFSPHSSIISTLRALYIDKTYAATGGNLLILQLGYRFTF